MYNNLIYSNNDGVATLTLNRPEAYNALSVELLEELTTALAEAQNDASVRVVVITGTGEKAFCSGADLKANAGMSAGQSLRQYYNLLIKAIRNIPKPVIGRINGLAVGAGCSLALACDLTIAVESAYFSQIFVNIGLMPDAGATFFLPRLVGMQRAFELSASGRKVTATEAQAMGLIHQCVSTDKFDEVVAQTIDYYKNAPTQAIGTMKLVLNQSLYSNLEQMLENEADGQEKLSQTKDFNEGVMSFLQKRKANFVGE